MGHSENVLGPSKQSLQKPRLGDGDTLPQQQQNSSTRTDTLKSENGSFKVGWGLLHSDNL